MKTKHILIASLCSIAIFTGCTTQSVGTAPQLACSYMNPDVDLASIGRVTFVELGQYAAEQTIAQNTTESIFLAMQKKQIFGIDIIRQNDPKWKSLQLHPDTSYSLDQLS
ncbi:MAG: hypothetical protein KAS23_08345, partial [Anaerohalosphaera sp.]|nr:hypothetical protein [Anaerohalosphaera sp.]